MRGKTLLSIVVLTGLLLAQACTGTKLINPWKDAAYQGHMSRMFVIGIVKDRGPRSLLENEFVRKLKERGIYAVASTALFPSEEVPPREDVRAKVRELGVDAVLVVKFIKKETGDTYTPMRNYAVPQNIIMSWDELFGVPDYNAQDLSYDYKVVTMQTTLFSVETGKPVWSSLSETRYEGGLIRQIKPFVSVIIGVLQEQKFIR
ncbi:MAG TPA: hypothetical protein VL122_12345 [Nitrospirota bacterium]|nr:hypothetical protein [Nitrospirota bacterium]